MHHHVQGELTGTQELHAEDQHADHQHQLGEDAGKLGQLDLQGRLALLGIGQRVGNLAHLGVHAGLGHHHAAAAVHHGGAHVDHVLPVTQGHVIGVVPQMDQVDELGDGDGFAGQGGLLHLHAGALQHASIRRDGVSRLQQHHIAHHQLLAADGDGLAVTQHLAGGGGHLLQCFDGLLRLALLIHAQHGVDDDHEQDDDHVGKAFVLHHRQHGADGGGGQQNDDHGIGHLLEEPLDEGVLLGLRQLVSAVFGKALRRLGGGQAAVAGGHIPQHGLRLFQIMLHIILPPEYRYFVPIYTKKRASMYRIGTVHESRCQKLSQALPPCMLT